MAAILFNDAEPFEQSVNKAPCEIWWKIGQVVLEKKTFTDFKVLYLYIAQGQGQISPPGGGGGGGGGAVNLLILKHFTTLIIHCKFQPLVLNIYWKKWIFNFFPHTNQQRCKFWPSKRQPMIIIWTN